LVGQLIIFNTASHTRKLNFSENYYYS